MIDGAIRLYHHTPAASGFLGCGFRAEVLNAIATTRVAADPD